MTNHPPTDDTHAVYFNGTHESVLAVMHLADAGRTTTELRIHAADDPAKSHITIPTTDGPVRVTAGDWIVRETDGSFRAHGPCPAALLPLNSDPVEHCVERPPHDTHRTAAGQTWTDDTFAGEEEQPEPTPLRWGLNDVLWGDDDTVTVLLSGPDGEPYWLELDPERANVLRQDLAGPDADEQSAEAHPAEITFRIETHDVGAWLPIGYPRPTLDEAREVRDLRRVKNPGARYRIVEWTASARVIETDEVPADVAAVTA